MCTFYRLRKLRPGRRFAKRVQQPVQPSHSPFALTTALLPNPAQGSRSLRPFKNYEDKGGHPFSNFGVHFIFSSNIAYFFKIGPWEYDL